MTYQPNYIATGVPGGTSIAYDATDSGIIVGTTTPSPGADPLPFSWTQSGGIVLLTMPGGAFNPTQGAVYACSANGNVKIGYTFEPGLPGIGAPTRWVGTLMGVPLDLTTANGQASCVTPDGSVAGGSVGALPAFWIGGGPTQFLPLLAGCSNGTVTGVDPTGTSFVGYCFGPGPAQGCYWPNILMAVDIGLLPGGMLPVELSCLSADGSTAGGFATDGSGQRQPILYFPLASSMIVLPVDFFAPNPGVVGLSADGNAAVMWDPNAQQGSLWTLLDGTDTLTFPNGGQVVGMSNDAAWIVGGQPALYFGPVLPPVTEKTYVPLPPDHPFAMVCVPPKCACIDPRTWAGRLFYGDKRGGFDMMRRTFIPPA